MPISFHASQISISQQDGLTVVILSVDETLEAERYLMFQREDKPSAEQVRSGMTDVYVETCGQGWSWYGHIESVRLTRTSIHLQLDAKAADEMRDTGRVDVTFDLAPDRFEALRAALRTVLKGRDYYVDAAA